MKKLFPSILFAVLSQAASSQQLQNTTFDDAWVSCYPWEAGKTVSSARGTQPEGWNISNVSNTAMPIVGSETTGVDGIGKAVKLSNVTASIGDQNAPGYMSLGTAWATAETKMTSVRNADGGVFGGIAFTYHPDAVRVTYKHDISGGAENMSVIAYLWKGTWNQEDVPSNTAVGVFSWGSAAKVTMTDRIQNILGKDCLTGGEITKTEDAALVASVEYYSNTAQNDWIIKEIPLDYGEYAGRPIDVEKLNIVIASNGLFDDRSAIKAGNSVTIDNVELVYYHALSSLSYEGGNLDFSEDITNYDLSSVDYDETKLAYVVKGQAATASTSYDEKTGVLTIHVEGEDISINPSSFTEYKIQFKAGADIERLTPNVTAEKTELLVDDYTNLILTNCDGLIAEYSVPGIISYENGTVTALSEGTVTLTLTQPQTETIKASVFEIEFSVSKHDVVWTWDVEQGYYFPNTIIENVFRVTSGDTSLFSYSTSDSKIAELRDGNLIIGEKSGIAIITIYCRGNVKWKTCQQQYEVNVVMPGHVPFTLTQDLYNTLKGETQGAQAWDDNGGIRLGNSSEIFSWSNRFYVMSISGIPDKLSFLYQSSSGASSRQYVIYESPDDQSYTEIWRDNKGSGVDGSSYQSGDIQLSPDTRYIKFFYYGNCAAYYRDVRVTELVKFASDKKEIILNGKQNTDSFTFTHANASVGVIKVIAPKGITVSVPEMKGGVDIYDKVEINVSYDALEGDVDDYIVITNNSETEKIHIIASALDPDVICGIKENPRKRIVYNISGQRISKIRKGINIVDGKKVLK